MAKLEAAYELISDKTNNPVTTTEYIKHGSDWLDTKINQMSSATGTKAEKSYVDTELAKKADSSTVSTLTTTVNGKADSSTVSALSNTVSGKADSSTVSALSTRVGTAETNIATQTARIDAIAALPSGSTSGDAELQDIRVGANGTTYADAGTAVRSQITDVKSDLNSKVTTSPNLFNKDSADNISGYFAGSTITVDSRYCLSHIIKMKSGITYKWPKPAELGANNRVAGYDNDGNYIDWYSAVADGDYWTYTPVNDKNVRINIGYAAKKDTAMVCEKNKYPQNYAIFGNYVNDDINIKDICIGVDGSIYQTAGTSVRSQFEDINAKLIKTVNLFDFKNSGNSLGYANKGTFTSDDRYCLSHMIPVKKDVTYKWRKPTELGTNNTINAYTTSGSYFDWKSASEDGDYYVYKSSFNGFIKVNVGYIDKSYDFMVCDSSKYPTKFIPYGIYVHDEVNGNPLWGKKAVFTGDSICAGAGDAGGYSKYVSLANKMTIQNIAVSGGTIVETEGHFDIGNSISSLETDADYVILEGGVNDASLNTPLGSITVSYWHEFDKSTFCGAFESMIKDTLERFPAQKKGYILVHKCTGNFASDIGNGSDGPHYTAVLKICQKWGIPVLNLQEYVPPFAFLSSEYPNLRAIRDKYTYNGDGWHPNALGYMTYYSDVISKWMKTL